MPPVTNPASTTQFGVGETGPEGDDPGAAPARVTTAMAEPALLRHCLAVHSEVTEVVFTPIGNDATRVAALLSGEVDVMEPVPVQDIDRVNSSANTRAITGPRCADAISACTPSDAPQTSASTLPSRR